MANDTLKQAEQFLHQHIPLTRAMGVQVVEDPAHGFAIEAPVLLNSNHLQTAFGGSINSVATLAGYAFLWFELREEIAHVVIGSSSIRFLRPIRDSIRAICVRPASRELKAFRLALKERGKARIALSVQVDEANMRTAQFDATFIAFRDTEWQMQPLKL
ncbi:MAG: thioesterase domain-containing protein [Verrucomicrobiota bacterium]|nr:thioesterase domain-containing protein [Verrucomicrobiota bacterium]